MAATMSTMYAGIPCVWQKDMGSDINCNDQQFFLDTTKVHRCKYILILYKMPTYYKAICHSLNLVVYKTSSHT